MNDRDAHKSEPDVLRPREVAARLDISLRKFYELAEAKQLPAFRVGNEWRVYKPDFLAYMRGEWKPPAD